MPLFLICLNYCCVPGRKLWLGVVQSLHHLESRSGLLCQGQVGSLVGSVRWSHLKEWNAEVEVVRGGTRRDSSEGELCRSPCWKRWGFWADQHLPNKLPRGFSKYCDNLVRTEPNRTKVGLLKAAIFLVVVEILLKKSVFFKETTGSHLEFLSLFQTALWNHL